MRINWYLRSVFSGVMEYIQSLGVTPEVSNFVASLPDNEKQFYVAELRNNPGIDLASLQGSVVRPEKRQSMYLPEEEEMASSFPPEAQKWILSNYRKSRNSDLNTAYGNLVMTFNPKYKAYSRMDTLLRDWLRTNSFKDVMDYDPSFAQKLSAMNPEDVNAYIHEWHEVQAGRGSGKMYGPTNQQLLAYGPQWKNEKWNGWTIQEVRGENDLEVEGNQMNHCVGSYCRKVDDDEVRIFSLRDPSNSPKVTIEFDPNMLEIEQIMGNSNSDPESEYQSMLAEWFATMSPKPSFEQKELFDAEDGEEFLDLLEGENEYGLPTGTEIDWSDVLENYLHYYVQNRRSHYDNTYSDHSDVGQNLMYKAMETGEKAVYQLLQQAWKAMDKVNDEIYWDFSYLNENGYGAPDPDDYEKGEDDEEYQSDFESWREKAEQEEMDETYKELSRTNGEYGIPRDVVDTYQKAVEKGELPDATTLYNKYNEKQISQV
jgi:hypothetical protein